MQRADRVDAIVVAAVCKAAPGFWLAFFGSIESVSVVLSTFAGVMVFFLSPPPLSFLRGGRKRRLAGPSYLVQ